VGCYWLSGSMPVFVVVVVVASGSGFEVIYYDIRNNNDIAVTWVLSSDIAGIGRNGGVEFEKEHNQDGHYKSQHVAMPKSYVAVHHQSETANASWAAKKYRGHRVLPHDIMEAL
jgi:hypothetical protein